MLKTVVVLNIVVEIMRHFTVFKTLLMSRKLEKRKVLPSRELTVSQQCISVFFTENVIYTVSPLISGPMYLATPNWPDGMNPSSSASWIITIPQEYKAELLFSNVSKPKCDSGHTEVSIGPLDSQGQTQSWREDQSFTGPVVQQQSFYLNMSNCEPKSDRFAVLSKISLQKEISKHFKVCVCSFITFTLLYYCLYYSKR